MTNSHNDAGDSGKPSSAEAAINSSLSREVHDGAQSGTSDHSNSGLKGAQEALLKTEANGSHVENLAKNGTPEQIQHQISENDISIKAVQRQMQDLQTRIGKTNDTANSSASGHLPEIRF